MPDKPPLILKRYGSTPYGTFGELNIRGKVFYTVERQWLDNVRSISCVPLGRYELKWRKTTTSVPENFDSHTWYLVGDSVGMVGVLSTLPH